MSVSQEFLLDFVSIFKTFIMLFWAFGWFETLLSIYSFLVTYLVYQVAPLAVLQDLEVLLLKNSQVVWYYSSPYGTAYLYITLFLFYYDGQKKYHLKTFEHFKLFYIKLFEKKFQNSTCPSYIWLIMDL